MNKERRNKLRTVVRTVRDCRDTVEYVLDEEDEARDNVSENLCGSPNYERSEECSDALGEALDIFDELIDKIEEAI